MRRHVHKEHQSNIRPDPEAIPKKYEHFVDESQIDVSSKSIPIARKSQHLPPMSNIKQPVEYASLKGLRNYLCTSLYYMYSV